MFVSQYVTDVERTPIKMDQKHSLDGVSWDYGARQVTNKGLQTVKNKAADFRSSYVGSLLPKDFDFSTVYVRCLYESVSFTDAYAFMMATYPETADGLDLMVGYTAISENNLPVSAQ